MTPSERQKKYVDRLKKAGRCVRCREKAMKDHVLCVPCTKKQRVYARTQTNSKPWRKGKAGRPPIHK